LDIKPAVSNAEGGPALADRVVLITGGSSGIGRAMAEALIAAQATVGIVSRRHPTLWDGGPPAQWDGERHWIEADGLDPRAFDQAVGAWCARHPVNMFINVAGVYGSPARHAFEETTDQEWDTLFTVNVRASFAATRLVLPHLRAREQALVIMVSSDAAHQASPGRVAYAASKAALHGLCSSLAAELQGTSTAVVELLPAGTVDTPGIRRRRTPAFNFSAYASPHSFRAVTLALASSWGKPHHGACLVVDRHGGLALLPSSSIDDRLSSVQG
jgi:NAD(P)-dependent dehydrogenase (short-subunit alcohol dehydrogenase family)